MAAVSASVAPFDLLKTKELTIETTEVKFDSPVEDIESFVPSTIDQLIRLRAAQSGNDVPIVAYPRKGTEYVDYTPRQLDQLVERAASRYTPLVPRRTTSDDPVQVVGILGNSDLDYLVTFLAVSRLGHTALLLSTRITDEAYESLLISTNATVLLHQERFAPNAAAVSRLLPSLKSGLICDVLALPPATLQPSSLDSARETGNICFIIHSSGSTGLPKPIYQTHRAAIYTYSQNFGLVGHITLPLYHNHGICCLFRAIYSRRKIYIYNASLPLASKHLLATLSQHPDIRILYGVPYALKLLSESAKGLELLSKLNIVMFGGSACPKPIGDRLVNSGVNLVGHYGATEVGQLMTSFRNHKVDKGWDWLRVPPHLKPYLSMELRGPNLYECCVNDGWGSKVATNRDDGSYATKDLFEPHVTIPDCWKYYARLDDTLTLENGEKVNPLLAEGVIRQNASIAEAVVFGAGKARLGAFVIPSNTSDLTDQGLIEDMMPSIVAMNKSMPAYSQLSKDMIKILPRDMDYRRTDKGTVIRAAFYRDFAQQIEAAYVDKQSGSLVLPKDELVDFLLKEMQSRVSDTASAKLSRTSDLFSLGVDSLQAIQVQSFIIKNLKLDTTKIGRNFVFDFPTIEKMADEILRLQSGAPEVEVVSIESQMAAMIERYAVFPQHVPVENEASGKYIVLTGATGSLGAHAVANLVAQNSVRRVYCLVRASDQLSADRRVRSSLRKRRVYHKLSLAARSKIVSLPSSLSDENGRLGLDAVQYDSIACKLTHVIHLAWSVNFNKGLQSFEDCIVGARNLMNLCLETRRKRPASFNFCSSVSATAATPSGVIPEALPESLTYAQNMGYAQSKLVTEHLCDRAAKETGLVVRVLRVGQIIGDTQHGVWNDTEAIPMIFQAAMTIGALPALDERPSWLPVDVVANATIEIACSAAGSGVMNVVNHNNLHWTDDLLPMIREAGLDFEEVPQQEWVRRLRASNQDPAENPPVKLVDFFASKYDSDRPKRKSAQHITSKAQSFSPALQNATRVDGVLIGKIVAQLSQRWRHGQNAANQPLVIVIGGPCGSGKTTITAKLQKILGLPLIEGDNLHTNAARESMTKNVPLTDGVRMTWLAHLRGAAMDCLRRTKAPAVLVTCSALKSIYRDELRSLRDIAGFRTAFIMLETGDREELRARLDERKSHYMGSAMVDAQVDALEAAREDETDVVPVDAARSPEQVEEECEFIVRELIH